MPGTLLRPETLWHRQKLPTLAVQGVGLDRSPKSRVMVEAPQKRAVAQSNPAPRTHQQGLGRWTHWIHPALKSFAPQDLIHERAGPRATPNLSIRGESLAALWWHRGGLADLSPPKPGALALPAPSRKHGKEDLQVQPQATIYAAEGEAEENTKISCPSVSSK
ncbi:hypothetical protein Y1Q_0017344 [Alligator mississippiensis]|uniref:Uncharacterized protein n=1 Tax=Alligator mississippiensis TaxID=8496 RepID=A0A151M7N7_ALLMI|nr:hypothetical protein Y1Q_0017344 [Alligator mississippiensis]